MPPLRPDLLGVAPMVARDTGNMYPPEGVSKTTDTSNQYLQEINDGWNGWGFIRLPQFIMNVARYHVPTKGEHNAGIAWVDHVVLEKINGSLNHPLRPGMGNLQVELVDAIDLVWVHNLAPVPVTPKDGWGTGAMLGLRWTNKPLGWINVGIG